MKKLFLLAALALGSATASAQKLETRNISGFTSVNVQNGIEVMFTQGPAESVTIEYGSGAAGDLVTDCYGTELKIYMKDQSRAQGTKVYITQKSLDRITAGSGAQFKIAGTLVVKNLSVKLDTGGLLEGAIHCEGKCTLEAATSGVAKAAIAAATFQGDITGGATVRISGKAEMADIFCSSATLLAGNFKVAKADIVAKRSSAVLMDVTDKVKADADDSSAITCYGNPEKLRLASDSYAVKRH